MIKLDMFWMTNHDWYEIVERDDGSLYDKLKDDAPPEAKISYEHYLEQIRQVAKFEDKTGYHVI